MKLKAFRFSSKIQFKSLVNQFFERESHFLPSMKSRADQWSTYYFSLSISDHIFINPFPNATPHMYSFAKHLVIVVLYSSSVVDLEYCVKDGTRFQQIFSLFTSIALRRPPSFFSLDCYTSLESFG